MMHERVGCEFDLESDGPVPLLMLVEPHPLGPHRIVSVSRQLQPNMPVREYRDVFGNQCWRLMMPGGRLLVRYDALVELSEQPDRTPLDRPLVPVDELPDDTLACLLPTRTIQADLLLDTAWDLFGSTPLTGARVQAICDWVHRNIRYESGSSSPSTTAVDTLNRGFGVCRDIALVSVALCRAMNIPARYAYGYMPDIGVPPPYPPMDFHAWFNAFIDGDWYTFDARYNVPRVGRIEIAHGRDVVDVAMTTSFGASRLNGLTVWSDEVDMNPAAVAELSAVLEPARGS
jgi:transglutaminase-like putative cysteine protease